MSWGPLGALGEGPDDAADVQVGADYWCDRGPCYLERGHDGRCTPG